MRRFAPLIACLPALALAQTAVPPTTAKPAAAKASDADKMVCRSIPEAGSLISTKRECHTRAEWAAESQAAQRQLSDCTTGAGATGARC